MVKRIRGAMFWRSALASASLIAMNHVLAAQDKRSGTAASRHRGAGQPHPGHLRRRPPPCGFLHGPRPRVDRVGALEPALKALEEQVSLRLASETSLTENLSTRGVEGEFPAAGGPGRVARWDGFDLPDGRKLDDHARQSALRPTRFGIGKFGGAR